MTVRHVIFGVTVPERKRPRDCNHSPLSVRQTFRIPNVLMQALEQETRTKGKTKTAIVVQALKRELMKR